MQTAVEENLRLDDLRTIEDMFAIAGLPMRVHKGRSVVQVRIDDRVHFLKRYWLAASQFFKGHVRRGFHELRTIDWLNENGFAGPRVVKRGWSGKPPFCRRMFFLMEEVPDEYPLEAAWSRHASERTGMLTSLASFAARLHDAGFIHTDFSERHILVGQNAKDWTFRLIDVERAILGNRSDELVANDLATLSASVMDQSLRQVLRTEFLDAYATARREWPARDRVRTLVENGKPTKSF